MNDPRKVSLYNHKSFDKPFLSNKEFMELRDKVENGDHKAYYDAIKEYAIEPNQNKLLLSFINNTIL